MLLVQLETSLARRLGHEFLSYEAANTITVQFKIRKQG